MTNEWKQFCKDCQDEFGYSHTSFQMDRKKGVSSPERCLIHRQRHADEIRAISASHFKLIPRSEPRAILGTPFLGYIDHGKRERQPVLLPSPDQTKIDRGLKDKHIQEIYKALEEKNQVLVITAPTGSGKSTFIPYRFLDPLPPNKKDKFTKHGPIIVTQPRIGATRSIPEFIAEKLYGSSVGPGFEIGYRHGEGSKKQGDDKVYKKSQVDSGKKENKDGEQYDLHRNRLIFVTDGPLLNWLIDGKAKGFSMVIIDEAHERSCTIDLILGLMKRELLKYPYLKLIILSATIDPKKFEDYYKETTSVWLKGFNDCGRSYGYQKHWWKGPQIQEEDMWKKVAEKVLELLNKTDNGGILGFLSGKEDIESAVGYIRKKIKGIKDIQVFLLYATLGVKKTDAALKESLDKVQIGNRMVTPRRVVIATNIAETSVTIPDVVYMVDSGLMKQEEWNPSTCRKDIKQRWNSQDGCKQRWGRAGRVMNGHVYPLYSEEKFNSLEEHTLPEIKRVCLDDLFLKTKVAGINNISQFDWIDPPPENEETRAINLINRRGLVDVEEGLTEDGLELYKISSSLSRVLEENDYQSTSRTLDVASLLIQADRYSCLVEAGTILAMVPRMGNSLYWNQGLFKWDKNWNLKSKDQITIIQRSLGVGCKDDLEFAFKLFKLYEGCKSSKSHLVDFGKRYFINLESFEEINEAREKMLGPFIKKTIARFVKLIFL